MKRFKLLLLFSLLILLISVPLFFIRSDCPSSGLALSPAIRRFARLKNRTTLAQPSDYEAGVTLAALLRPGDDRGRWSESRAGAIEGYVIDVKAGGIEAANCYSVIRRDTHIHLALRPDAPLRESMVLEITPEMREWAGGQGRDWSESTLRRELVGHWCYFEGWLLFDIEHADESENTAQGGSKNWRATAWELHPITYFKVVK